MNNVTTDKRRNHLASEYNYDITKYFSENLMAIEMKKKNIYLGLSIFWYNCIIQNYQDRAKLCYMDTGSFIIRIKTEDFYEDIANDV